MCYRPFHDTKLLQKIAVMKQIAVTNCNNEFKMQKTKGL